MWWHHPKALSIRFTHKTNKKDSSQKWMCISPSPRLFRAHLTLLFPFVASQLKMGTPAPQTTLHTFGYERTTCKHTIWVKNLVLQIKYLNKLQLTPDIPGTAQPCCGLTRKKFGDKHLSLTTN